MVIYTDRLFIRLLTEGDLEGLAHLLGNEEVMRFSLKGGPFNLDETKNFLKKVTESHMLIFGVFLKEQLIGFVALVKQQIDGEEKMELGYRFHPDYWGKGFAAEAARALCRYAFSELGLKELTSIIDPGNARSIGLAKRLGMHFWKKTLFHGIPVEIYMLDQAKGMTEAICEA